MSVLFMVGVLSLQNRSVFMGDGGDNVIHLMAIYLVFTRCGQVWSLDARRARLGAGGTRAWRAGRARTGSAPSCGRCSASSLAAATLAGRLSCRLAGWSSGGCGRCRPCGGSSAAAYAPEREPRILLDVVANLVHNAALFVIMAEACLIYATAGWYKIQGSRWQDGTAVYYPLHLDYFSPWPALSDLLTGQRHDGDAGDVRDGHRAGRLPVHAVQPAGQERPAGRR